MSAVKKNASIQEFSEDDKELYPLLKSSKKYPKHLAVLQNSFWNLQHEKPPKDDLIKLLLFFSPKVRLLEDTPNERTVFSISAQDYATLTGLQIKGAYSALERIVDSLYNHSVIFNHHIRGNVRTRLVTSSSYRDGVFSVSFTHFAIHIMSVFSKENPFTTIQIKSIAGLSGHALRLYPLFVQNEFRQNFDVDITDLKELLNIDVNSYSDYKEFKKHVLKPHVDMINLKTEFSVQFHAVKKESRKASHVGFIVSRKKDIKQTNKPQPQPKEHPTNQYDDALQFVVRQLTSKNLYDRLKEDPTESNLQVLERISKDIKNGNHEYWKNKIEDMTFELELSPPLDA